MESNIYKPTKPQQKHKMSLTHPKQFGANITTKYHHTPYTPPAKIHKPKNNHLSTKSATSNHTTKANSNFQAQTLGGTTYHQHTSTSHSRKLKHNITANSQNTNHIKPKAFSTKQKQTTHPQNKQTNIYNCNSTNYEHITSHQTRRPPSITPKHTTPQFPESNTKEAPLKQHPLKSLAQST